ncbi:hypothetical protein P8452_60094 [Trifolium repens]|nr:hypothetical protein P8452_60094 [Trifolium repens]
MDRKLLILYKVGMILSESHILEVTYEHNLSFLDSPNSEPKKLQLASGLLSLKDRVCASMEDSLLQQRES